MDAIKLCKIYNNSDIEALDYMRAYLKGDLLSLCDRLISLNINTKIGWGKEDYSPEELNEYYDGKWKLLSYFGLENRDGDAYYNGKFYQ